MLVGALTSLEHRLQHINQTVVLLDDASQRAFDVLQLALTTLTELGFNVSTTTLASTDPGGDNETLAVTASTMVSTWREQLMQVSLLRRRAARMIAKSGHAPSLPRIEPVVVWQWW